ncbi:MAG: hypothetical protein ACI9DG_002754 [Oleispira sp.]
MVKLGDFNLLTATISESAMNSPLNKSAEPYTPWYKEPWMFLVAGVPIIAVCWGMVIITLAVTGKDSLVSDSYYKDGMAFTENNIFIDKAKRLQLKADMVYNQDAIRVTITGYLDEQPSFLTLQLIHPTLETRDETVLLQQKADGSYLGLTIDSHLGKRKLWVESLEQEWMIKDEALIENGKLLSLRQ